MRRWNRQVIVAIVAVLAMPGFASAQWQQSTSYGMNESQIGGNGLFNSGSAHYSINPATDNGGESLGAAAVGSSSSTSYSTSTGFDTTSEPGLYFWITNGTINLGVLQTGSASTGTATFAIRDYTSTGYNVYMVGTAPTSNGHALTADTTDSSWASSTEEFGVNMVSNSSVSGSANPVCGATGYCYGVAGDGSTNHYTQTNKFRFNNDEIVASGAQSSGETDYTMSFMAGRSNVTPAGTYKGSISLVAVGSY